MLAASPGAAPPVDRAALALARALVPGSRRIPAADDDTARTARDLVGMVSPMLGTPWDAAVRALDLAAVARTGRRLQDLDPDAAEELVRAWQRDPVLRQPLNVVSLVHKMAHFDRPEVIAALGGQPNDGGRPEPARWLAQITPGAEWDGGDLECDAVVVGTGAGGAVVGRELAERGHAVVFLEEGEHHRRDAFDGSLIRAHQRFYRAAVAVGNAVIPVFIGRMVGGSTAINGGTSFRTPPWVLDRWCEDLHTDELSREAMEPHFRRVEQVLGIQPARQPEVGPIAGVIARGCDRLGWRHFAIQRNAQGCTGKGFCDLGCATDARRSTNLAYLPPALERGSVLLTGIRVDRVIVEGGRAVGVEGVASGGRRVKVRARAVILAGGTVPTPLLLLAQGLANGSGQVGRNLTLHPSSGVVGLFDEVVDPAGHIPQGYGCDHFLREGQLLTAAQPTPNVAPIIFQLVGRRLMDVLDRLEHLASLAVLVRDSGGNGRVWRDVAGRPAITYNLSREDRDNLHQGMLRIMDLLAAAGARRFWANHAGFPIVELHEMERYRRTPPSPAELGLASYHPLGTIRMGRDPRTSVVDLDHEAHEVPGLFVVDGSTVPGALGVNPQLTIMAMATRAAGKIAERLA